METQPKMNFFKTCDLYEEVERGEKTIWEVLDSHGRMERQFRRMVIVIIKSEAYWDHSKMSKETLAGYQTFIANAKEGLGVGNTEEDPPIKQEKAETADLPFLLHPQNLFVFPSGQIIALPESKVKLLTYDKEQGVASIWEQGSQKCNVPMTEAEFKAFSDATLRNQPVDLYPAETSGEMVTFARSSNVGWVILVVSLLIMLIISSIYHSTR